MHGAGRQKTVPGNKGRAFFLAAGSKLFAPCSKRPERARCRVPGARDDKRRRSLQDRACPGGAWERERMTNDQELLSKNN